MRSRDLRAVEYVRAHNMLPLPAGIRSRTVPGVNGLAMHVLEAGALAPERPCVVLLHGFPELAYSWREVMLPLADAGFYVVAPDQRGYGRTTGWDGRYEADLDSFRMPNLVEDVLALVSALGYRSVAAVVGHDFGAPVAAYCALLRPEVFRSLALMSAPFAGPPQGSSRSSAFDDLARLDPPRKHYTMYYSTPEANGDMLHCAQGLHAFLRAYYHVKSADWNANQPFALRSSSAEELAKLPAYYVMERDKTMPETVAPDMPSAQAIAACTWLPDDELAVYTHEFSRTGLQGGLQWYRCRAPKYAAELAQFAGMTVRVPAIFVAGEKDWGVYQTPGAFTAMQTIGCAQLEAVHLLPRAGHWVQQEQPKVVCELLLAFLEKRSKAVL
jgi:pimeloyl-ACP methyl ester carboxylesterase